MKLIIAGGRDYQFTDEDFSALDKLHEGAGIIEVVSGCARGADTCGEEWARRNGIPVKKFPADWKKYGKRAGYIRNSEMAQYADGVALFPGGKGTEMMRLLAKKQGLAVYQMR